MTSNFKKIICAVSCFVFLHNADAQQSQVKSRYDSAKLAYQKLVESNPDNLDNHHKFLNVIKHEDAEKQYLLWMTRFPTSAVVPYAIGEFYFKYEEGLKGQGYLAEAVKRNPRLAGAWNMMAYTAANYDHAWAQKYALIAKTLEPNNPEYVYTYAYSFKGSDRLKFDSLLTDINVRFPSTETSMLAYHDLINNTKDISKKDNYFSAILKSPPNKLSNSYNSRIVEYYNFLLINNINKAVELAEKMSIDKQHVMYLTGWKQRITFAKNFKHAQNLIASNKIDSAKTVLDSIKITPNSALFNSYLKLKAQVMSGVNNPQDAYRSLIKEYSKLPTDDLHTAMITYGNSLGLTESDIMANVWTIRDSSIAFANDFKLKSFLNSDTISLSKFRGKVILLTYWFPGCGPCLREFPQFETALKKVNNKNVIYLGANLLPLQNKQVMPLVKLNNYSFIPMHDDWNRKKGNLSADGAPSNYLIDQKGRIIFKDFRIDEINERTLELMITEILTRPTDELHLFNMLDTAKATLHKN